MVLSSSSEKPSNLDLYTLASYECRVEKQPVTLTNTTEIIIPSDTALLPGFNDKVTKSANPCIFDLLNLKYTFFLNDSLY